MASIAEIWSEFWHNFLDFFFPPLCQLCGKPSEQIVCAECESSLAILQAGYIPKGLSLEFVRPLAPFDSAHRRLIHLMKYSGVVDIADFFGNRIGTTLLNEDEIGEFDLLIPVPLHRHRHRERTYNQAELLARSAARASNFPIAADAVVRVKNTKSQTTLSAIDREINVKGAFVIQKPETVRNKAVIIVDDVVTTGATTNEIAKLLLTAGAKRVCAVCIAHPEHHESRQYGI